MIDIKKIEEETLKFWEENKIYEKSKKKNAKGKKFYFLQGPPYTSGKLHIGHAWNNSMKDIALRFFRLNGYDIWDRAGYDMHGLPTETKVQKELKLKEKEDIVKFGLDKFAKRCRDFSKENVKLMNNDLKRLGIWMDFENAYLPIENSFMSSEWLLFKKAYEQERLYKGKKIMHWCGECETSLAKHELEYENVTENSVFLKFKIKNTENEYLVIWTTTPWTIPYNLAVMVNPDLKYLKSEVETKNGVEKWIVAKQLTGVFISGLLGLKSKVLEEFTGSEMLGLEYEHPFYKLIPKVYDELKKKFPKVHTVILSKEYVDTSAGSGLVHCAPGCGPEDYEVGKEYGIGAFNTLDEKGVLQDLGEFSGMTAKKDDKEFIKKLDRVGALIIKTPVEHEYAHCWRCHNPVVFRTTEQWFLKIEDLIPKILEYDKKIKWQPEMSKKNYEAWISNLKDNGITRQRFWGTPMPIWECEKCEHIEVIESIEELEKKAISPLPKDLHKPWIDSVFLKCKKCSSQMKRVPDVIDVWIDSGTVSWNSLYYPERQDLLKKFFPADLILEATEQTRLWFSMLQLCSTIVFGKKAYVGAYNHGMIFDFQGTKMSKSLGNIISPYEVIDKYSSEILRYYICETAAGKNINFNWEEVKQKQRNLLVLLNTANYLVQLKSIVKSSEKSKPGLEEEYILSRLNSSIKKTTELFNEYKFDNTITEIQEMFLDISRKYIKFTRDKIKENPELVFETLKKTYVKTLQMFSCICPLFTESIWQNLRKNKLVKEESIHLTNWPKFDEKLINKKLEENMGFVLEAVEKGLGERDRKQIGLKWPLPKAIIKRKSNEVFKGFEEIIKNQLNVKKIELVEDETEIIEIELDTNLTPELMAEGYARELSRFIQNERKNNGLVITDVIVLEISGDLAKIIRPQEEFIKQRINAKEISIEESETEKEFSYSKEGKIKKQRFKIKFNKI